MPDSTSVERTADGRYVIIGGRRWRASNPHIPPKLRQELVDELMSARRAVKADAPAARSRVQDAKVALGERGHPWWEQASADEMAPRIESTIKALLRHRDGSSICPSDVARVVGGEQWRDRMQEIRHIAAGLAESNVVVITQRDQVVDVATARGPVRIARGSAFDSDV